MERIMNLLPDELRALTSPIQRNAVHFCPFWPDENHLGPTPLLPFTSATPKINSSGFEDVLGLGWCGVGFYVNSSQRDGFHRQL